MSSQQKGILWIGLIIVMIFLFTDQNFRNSIFNKGNTLISSSGGSTTTNKAPYSLAQILTVPTQPQQPTVNLV